CNMIKEKFNIEGMSCSACSAAVEKAVSHLDGVKVASVNLLGKTMFVEYNEKVLSPDDIIKAVTAIGFSAILEPENDKKDIVKNTAPAPDNEFTNVKTRLIVSLCFLIPLMYVAMGHMIGLPFTRFFHEVQNAIAFGFTQFLLTLPIIYVNRKFFFVGFKALWRKSPNMDSLIAVGSTAALVYGVFSIYMMGHGLGTGNSDLVNHYMMNLYFESAGMILTLVTVGKFLEERSKGKTNTAITKLMDLSPKEAVVLRGDIETTVSVEEIVMDDIIIIRPGEKIPVDGVIIEGSSSLDQSALTGESIPVDKSLGDTVMSASINIDGTLKIKATKVGKNTTLAHIIELVENASSSKAPIARLADKVSGIFVPIVMLIAVISVVVWLILGQGFEFALGIG
ncbi:MAG: heavy metal translocating P-type ATPase, partial [Oscillospiraceae bacterium]